jgi:asparagine synthetase B (glutamine-hydrolysing)
MPGLFGWIDLAHDTERDAGDVRALLAEMAQRMSHTGGELVETFLDEERGFAIGRIARRELVTTPWAREGGGGRAFVEGSLRGDEARAAARVDDLARRGAAALAGLAGSFTAARWEPEARRLVLAVDRRASRPLAWTVAGGALYFAPEVKALLAAPGVDRTIDEAAVGVFLGAGYLLAQQTLFAKVRRLAGGEALVIEGGRARIEPYWRYRLNAGGDGTKARDLEMELAELVRGAVERSVGDPERTVVFLSGGVDSRAIASAAQDTARRRGEAVRTITWAAPGAREGSDRDVAAQVAAALGTRHESATREIHGWGAQLVGVTYLLDGLTDVPAYHPHEYALMRGLSASGAKVVLRGDECFGWEASVATHEEARLSLNLRAAGPLRGLSRVARPGVHARLAESSREALAAELRPLAGEHPDDAKDLLYFRHRLQSYLGSAAYLKQVLFDHRAPLVDEAILELNGRVPASLRANKRLFCRAAARNDPELFAIPLARRGNLEDWGMLLASRSPVRRAVEAHLADGASGIWELFDREALCAALPAGGIAPDQTAAARLERGAKTIARTALSLAPPIERRLTARAHRAGLRVDQLCLRVVVLKVWHDLFVRGDGSRRALDEALAKSEPHRDR